MKQLKLSLIITAGILAVILACIFGVNSFKNNAISQEERVNSAMSDIKVYEKRRADLIPNLVDTIKAYDIIKDSQVAVIGKKEDESHVVVNDVKSYKQWLSDRKITI